MRACLNTSVGWGPRACSGRIRAGFGAMESLSLGYLVRRAGVWGRRKGRKTMISLSVVELALTASPSKAWDGARFGP